MGYLHINNLERDPRILLFRRCYALEKIHGTSAHVTWDGTQLHFHVGGISQNSFIKIFDLEALTAKCKELLTPKTIIFGEAYGGKCQAQAFRYGPTLRFAAFDVKTDDTWMSVPVAAQLCQDLGLEFVAYEEIATDLPELDRVRNQPSKQAIRNGIMTGTVGEGVVLRPLLELDFSGGERVIAKYKTDAFRETMTIRTVGGERQSVLTDAEAIAYEWVTPMRLEHILGKINGEISIQLTGQIVKWMVEDVYREAAGEIVPSKETERAIGSRTVLIFKEALRKRSTFLLSSEPEAVEIVSKD